MKIRLTTDWDINIRGTTLHFRKDTIGECDDHEFNEIYSSSIQVKFALPLPFDISVLVLKSYLEKVE